MKIEYSNGEYKYYDVNGTELHENDIVFVNGKNMRVLLTDNDELGTDATNPAWIKMGRACEGEFGVYPFHTGDDPLLVCAAGAYCSFDCVTGEIVKKAG